VCELIFTVKNLWAVSLLNRANNECERGLPKDAGVVFGNNQHYV